MGPDRAQVTGDRGGRAFDRCQIRLDAGLERAAGIRVTLGLEYRSVDPTTDAPFAPFGEISLPLSWRTYVREFVSTTMGLMSWPPLSLPALKRHVHAGRLAEAVTP